MNVNKSTRVDRVEGVIRGLLGLVLLAAAVWAMANGSGDSPSFAFGSLQGW